MMVNNQKGINLLSLIISITVLLVLSAIVFFSIDPVTRITAARDSVRKQDVLIIAQALDSYVQKNQGIMPTATAITTDKKVICSSESSLSCDGDTQTCVVIHDDNTSDFFANYLRQWPVDPAKAGDTDTGYYLTINANGNLTVGACASTTINYISSVKPVAYVDPDACGGYDDGSYCWYGASLTTETCDDVCSGQGTTCSADAGWDDDDSCTIAEEVFGANACDSACLPSQSGTHLPGKYNGLAICASRDSASATCSAGGGSYLRLCACNL